MLLNAIAFIVGVLIAAFLGYQVIVNNSWIEATIFVCIVVGLAILMSLGGAFRRPSS